MKEFLEMLVLVMVTAVFITSCAVISPVEPIAEVVNQPLVGSHVELLQQAREAYDAGAFELAAQLAQQAIQIAPDDSGTWTMYEQAVLANSGNDYLKNLPDDRYRLDTEQFFTAQADGKEIFILDVREPDEFADGFVPGAVNVPLRHVGHNLDQLPQDKDTPIVVYCRSMKRSTHALVVLRQLGYNEVYNLKGGILAYSEFVTENPNAVPDGQAGGAVIPTAEPGSEYFGDDC